MAETVLDIQDLVVTLQTESGHLTPVDRVSLRVRERQTVALVGESGSGKSLTALAIMRLLSTPPMRIAGGKVLFAGSDLLALSEPRMRRIRGNSIAMIFQEPMSALNPLMTIGDQVAEAVRRRWDDDHQQTRPTRSIIQREVIDLLARVGLADPARRARDYPHRLSGGMRQRVMIAMALAAKPDLLIADEPTTALDVTIQAQILDLLRGLQRETGMAMLFITHDLGLVAGMADRVEIMYAGRIVESAPTDALFSNPKHPYTQALLRCVPRLDRFSQRLETIPGAVPSLTDVPRGCRFHPRCERGRDDSQCRGEEPDLMETGAERSAACWKIEP